MPATNAKLTAAVETYLSELRQVRASGGATAELSYYPPLANLLKAVGNTLKPKVVCVSQLAQQGAGHPDFGLYAARQVQRGRPREGQLPERGVVEVKPADDDAWLTAQSDQVTRYWDRYGVVLVTNFRDFLLVGEDAEGRAARLESFRLADSAEDFDLSLQKPRAFARRVGPGLGEYLSRALSHRAALAEPRDLAWLLASYARDGLARVESAGDAPSLAAIRSALEQALGVRFEGDRGAAFFRSTLVQTLFYGVFSAWVLWARRMLLPTGSFNWREAVWHLRAPVLRALFQQLSDPGRLQPLGLVEVLDWTAAALDRVDQSAFFNRFNEGEAVPYFYEPFLQAFDPALRKQLGVWYTPTEVVRYMVARVDRALKDDLGIAEGLAARNVYVLDPCCGTGAYLGEVLRRIALNLQDQGLGALTGARVRQAALERVFGFEIMPAPFVVAHLQVGLTMQELDAPLSEDADQRPGVFLTNALTGWEPTVQKPLPFPELEEERDRAERIKQKTPVLVILGNPPYNGFAGVAVEEEWELLEAYRNPMGVKIGDTRALNDLYVRFFRMAERRIVEKTGQGVVCFISNYSWLDGLSFTGMRERYLGAFDAIRIDNVNGDKYRTGKVAPDGSPDPSIFSTPEDPVGIQVGTAIATLVRRAEHAPAASVEFRNLWGQAKLAELTETADADPDALYDDFKPLLPLGLPFAPMAVSEEWFDWPALPDLFPVSFPGVHTGRDRLLVDIDLDRLKERIADYFNPDLSHEEIQRRYPAAMRNSSAFRIRDARKVRDAMLTRGGPNESGFVRDTYRPFDNRWLYWEADRRLLTAPSPDYWPHISIQNLWLSSAQHLRKGASEPQACVTGHVGSFHLIERGAAMFPAWLRDDGLGTDRTGSQRRPNLSGAARHYLDILGMGVEDLFHHVLSVLHDPAYRRANAGALRMEWPRIPLPAWPDPSISPSSVSPSSVIPPPPVTPPLTVIPAKAGIQSPLPRRERDRVRVKAPSPPTQRAAQTLAASAARGRQLARLLDPETAVPGVTTAPFRPEIAAIAVPSTIDGRNMSGEDFDLTARWGYFGPGQAVMPGQGRVTQRPYTPNEHEALSSAPKTTGNAVPLSVIPAKAGNHTQVERQPGKASVIPAKSGIQSHSDAGQQPTASQANSPTAEATLGATTRDIHFNDRAYWRNVPAAVWDYKLGGYQVLKKWLSYRERTVLGRPLTPDEIHHFTATARRIAAILLLTHKSD